MMTRIARLAKQTSVIGAARHCIATIGGDETGMQRRLSPAGKFRRIGKIAAAGFAIFFALPLAAHSVVHWTREAPENWSSANWGSSGELPPAGAHEPAMVRIFAARTGRWKGNFAVHSWIVFKEKGAANYQRYDKVGWGMPIRVNNYPPDGLWYSNRSQTIFAADGTEAEKLIPKLREAIAAYPHTARGSYSAWPGPNSNTFVSCVMARIPEIASALPPTAIGKDYPCDGSWFGTTTSGTGLRLNFGGYGGLAAGWIEGFEINILGAVAGFDIRRPAIKLPGFGRIGFAPV